MKFLNIIFIIYLNIVRVNLKIEFIFLVEINQTMEEGGILFILFNAINDHNNLNGNYVRPVLYRQLRYNEEREMYNQLTDAPNNTVIFYDERQFHRYYFVKFNYRPYHIVTNSDMSRIYTIYELNE